MVVQLPACVGAGQVFMFAVAQGCICFCTY